MYIRGGDARTPRKQMTKENPQTLEEFKEFITPLIEEVKKEKEYELTDKEARLTEAGEISYEYFYEEIGYQNCDGDPACFCFTLKEGMEAGFTKHQVAGLIGSLEAKGVIDIEHRDHYWEGPDLFWLSENFVNFIARKNIAKEEAN